LVNKIKIILLFVIQTQSTQIYSERMAYDMYINKEMLTIGSKNNSRYKIILTSDANDLESLCSIKKIK